MNAEGTSGKAARRNLFLPGLPHLAYKNNPPLRPASEPARTRPGTIGKIEALAARAAAGEELWHEADFTAPDDWI